MTKRTNPTFDSDGILATMDPPTGDDAPAGDVEALADTMILSAFDMLTFRELTIVPPSTAFDAEFIAAPELRTAAGVLLEHCNELYAAAFHDITYLWKAKAVGAGAQQVAGKCIKAGGPMRYFAGTEWVIWLAADVFRHADQSVIAAALYHELKHIDLDPDSDAPLIRKHDFEGFADELARFGLWRPAARTIADTIKQLGLFDDGGDPDSQDADGDA